MLRRPEPIKVLLLLRIQRYMWRITTPHYLEKLRYCPIDMLLKHNGVDIVDTLHM